MRVVNGDILNATEDIICHQVNCVGAMGAGLARQIRSKWPEVFRVYQNLCNMSPNKERLLGYVQIIPCTDGKMVANLFGQNTCGAAVRQTDYDALGTAFTHLFSAVTNVNEYKGRSVAIPYKIGCGLAGGDWSIVSEMIDKIASTYNVENYTIYKFKE